MVSISELDQSGFERFLSSFRMLSRDTAPDVDGEITNAAIAFAAMPEVSAHSITDWVTANPESAYVLGLVLGMTRARLKNELRRLFGVTSATKMAMSNPEGLVAELNRHFRLVERLTHDLGTQFMYADVLVARYAETSDGSRVSPRSVEDEVERMLIAIGADYTMQCSLVTPLGPRRCDFAIPGADRPEIVVVARGFDTPGPVEADAVAEISALASSVSRWSADAIPRRPQLYVVVDGIGWPRRDVVRLYHLRESGAIDGIYTLALLDELRQVLKRRRRRYR